MTLPLGTIADSATSNRTSAGRPGAVEPPAALGMADFTVLNSAGRSTLLNGTCECGAFASSMRFG